jgi:hypothetical protein
MSYNCCPCIFGSEFNSMIDQAQQRKNLDEEGLLNFEGLGYSAGSFSTVYDNSGHRGYINLFRKTYLDDK